MLLLCECVNTEKKSGDKAKEQQQQHPKHFHNSGAREEKERNKLIEKKNEIDCMQIANDGPSWRVRKR